MLQVAWDIFRDSAVYLMLGFLLAGLLRAVIDRVSLFRHLQAPTSRSVWLATLIGIPLPLCSCSVLPTAVALRRQGASSGATLSFLVSTPETSVTSILLTYSLLGPVLAVVRPVAAAVTAITAGLVGHAIDDRRMEIPAEEAPSCGCAAEGKPVPDPACGCASTPAPAPASASCCSTAEAPEPVSSCGCATAEPDPVVVAEPESSCCSSDAAPAPIEAPFSLFERIREGLRFSFVTLFDDVIVWVFIGILAAAAIQTWAPPSVTAALFDSFWPSVALMVAIGVPLYVFAEASTPIAASLLVAGLSPGAALVFLLVGPATNIGSLGLLRKLLGTRLVAGYIASIIVVSVLVGYAFHLMVGAWGIPIDVAIGEHAHDRFLPGGFELAGALLMLAFSTGTAWRWARRRFPAAAGFGHSSDEPLPPASRP